MPTFWESSLCFSRSTLQTCPEVHLLMLTPRPLEAVTNVNLHSEALPMLLQKCRDSLNKIRVRDRRLRTAKSPHFTLVPVRTSRNKGQSDSYTCVEGWKVVLCLGPCPAEGNGTILSFEHSAWTLSFLCIVITWTTDCSS